MELAQLVTYLDGILRVRDIPDAPDAMNGLQVANGGAVRRVAAAVDVCEATIQGAADHQANLLIVHHGLFWGGPRPLTGPQLRRVAGLLRHDLALYSSHLPLDLHPELGNNPVLARALGLSVRGAFGETRGAAIGLWGELALPREELRQSLGRILGAPPKVMGFGPERTQRVGIVTGAAGSMIAQAAAAGLDTFITGEGTHHAYFEAEELGINVFFGGHYATETGGVKALAQHLETKFGLPWVFIDHPTGL